MRKPRVAICFSGLPSYIDENKGYWLELIERYDADVYASLWRDEEELFTERRRLTTRGGDTINNFIDSYKPIKIELENYKDFQKNTLSHLTEDIDNYAEEGETWQETFLGLYKKDYKAIECAFSSGRVYATLYKVWRANMLKDCLGRKYDIVVRAETCSSFPDLSLDRVDDYKGTQDCINLLYWLQTYYARSPETKKPELKFILNHWVAFGPPDLMDYYCSAFLYIKKYSEQIVIQPPENILTHHLANRPNMKLRLFFNKIFRKGYMHWNGHSNGYDIHRTSGKENPEIDKNSRHAFCGSLENTEVLDNCLPPKINIQKKVNTNLVKWPNNRPSQKEPKRESAYIKLDIGHVGKETRKMLDVTIKEVEGFSMQVKEDGYGNIYPEYKKR